MRIFNETFFDFRPSRRFPALQLLKARLHDPNLLMKVGLHMRNPVLMESVLADMREKKSKRGRKLKNIKANQRKGVSQKEVAIRKVRNTKGNMKEGKNIPKAAKKITMMRAPMNPAKTEELPGEERQKSSWFNF